MELSFASIELRHICESQQKAVAAIGAENARELKRRLAELDAMPTVEDFYNLFKDDLIHRSSSERSIQLSEQYQLVFCAGHVRVPTTVSGAVDWAKVSRVKITALEKMDG